MTSTYLTSLIENLQLTELHFIQSKLYLSNSKQTGPVAVSAVCHVGAEISQSEYNDKEPGDLPLTTRRLSKFSGHYLCAWGPTIQRWLFGKVCVSLILA